MKPLPQLPVFSAPTNFKDRAVFFYTEHQNRPLACKKYRRAPTTIPPLFSFYRYIRWRFALLYRSHQGEIRGLFAQQFYKIYCPLLDTPKIYTWWLPDVFAPIGK